MDPVQAVTTATTAFEKYGFFGLSAVLLVLLVWVVWEFKRAMERHNSTLIEVIKENNGVIQANTVAINNNAGALQEIRRDSDEMKRILLRLRCVAEVEARQ